MAEHGNGAIDHGPQPDRDSSARPAALAVEGFVRPSTYLRPRTVSSAAKKMQPPSALDHEQAEGLVSAR